jgi:hypothetical protein
LTIGLSQGAASDQVAAARTPQSAVSADDPDQSAVGGYEIDEAVVANFDAERAQQRGVSVEQVRADDASGAELGALAATLEGDFPDLYVQSEWRYDEYPNAQIVLSEEAPGEVRQLIDTLSFPVDVVVSSDGPSRWEAMEIVEKMQSLLTVDSEGTSVGSYDPLTGIYTVTVEGPRPAEDILQQVYALAGNKTVELRFGDADVHAEPAYIGGEGGLYGCTAGFVVRNGPTFGISTANHCPVPQPTFSYLGSSFWWGGSLDRAYGDAEWGWALSGTPVPVFRQTTTSILTARGLVAPYIGLGHCTYGSKTFTTCATVVGLNTVVDYGPADGTYRNLVRDGGNHIQRGDSGGPNFGTGGQVLGYSSGNNPEYTFWTSSSALQNFAHVMPYVS